MGGGEVGGGQAAMGEPIFMEGVVNPFRYHEKWKVLCGASNPLKNVGYHGSQRCLTEIG